MFRDVQLGDQTKRVSRKHLLLSKSARLQRGFGGECLCLRADEWDKASEVAAKVKCICLQTIH